jgi:hypothetical protein
MNNKTKKEARVPLIPTWVPNRFEDILDKKNYRKYKSGLTEVMAAELRALVISLGEGIVLAIRSGDILPEKSLNTLLNRLKKCWPDPVAHEKDLFSIQKELAGKYKVTLQEIANGGEYK